MTKFFCPVCEQWTTASLQDVGLGAYEYWGQRGVDKDVRFLTDCCQATPFEDAEMAVEGEYEPPDDYI